MAKARGNKLVPPANYSRNPMFPAAEAMSLTPTQRKPLNLYQGALPQQAARPPAPVNPMEPEPPNLKGMTMDQMVEPVQRYMMQKGFIPNTLYPQAGTPQQPPIAPTAPQYGARVNAFQVGADPAAESARRLAPMMARDAARQQNTPMNGNTAYANNPLRLTPDQKLSLAEQSTARYMGGGAAADPTGLAGRFNPMADQINSQANAVASGRGWYLGGKFVGATGNPQWGKEENMRRRVELNNAPQQATQEQRDSAQARRAGAQRQFMDENNGMNYLQARRAERQAGLKERSFRKAVTRGLNPMSPEAQALFPQQVAKMKGQPSVQADQNPMLQAFQPGAPNTPENLAAKDSVRSNLEADSPTVRAMGIAGGDPQQAITSLASFQGDVSDDGLTDLHSYVLSIPRDKDRAHPFESVGDETLAPELMGELYNLPPNTPPATLRKWYDKYRAAVNARRFGNTPQNQQQQYSQGWSGSGNMPVMPFNAPMGR